VAADRCRVNEADADQPAYRRALTTIVPAMAA